MSDQIEEKTIHEEVTIDGALWQQLLDLTDGAAAVCYQCGVCTAVCPWGLVKEETVSVRKYMRDAQLGILPENGNENVWLCTTCAQCEAYCPRSVSISEVFRGLRYIAWENRKTEDGLPSALWSVYWNNNPWAQPPSQRTQWAKDLDIPMFDPDQHEVLLYVGCAASYDRRAQQIARSLVRVFRAADVSFGILGDDEPCCGETVMNLGHKPYFQEIVQQTSQAFEEKGVTQLVTVSPHSYDVFKNRYQGLGRGFQPIHYTQYLAMLLEEGRLQFDSLDEQQVTFHDPCYLARHNEQTEAPRMVLSAIQGLELVEMENAGVDTLCCGGGGGRMLMETAAGERFSDLRVQEALETGATILATACPFCVSCLEDSLKAQKIDNIVVMDIVEIAALALAEQEQKEAITHG
jgi:Fe-S oxidoreductase